jgi:hypothetical protein
MESLKRAILATAMRLLPDGFDVADDAPQTFEELNVLLNSGSRMRVWSGASRDTIYQDANVNFAFRAWHDLCHWWGLYPFTLEGEIATCEMQCRQLIYNHGEDEITRGWCKVLRAEVIGQADYFQRHKRFPEIQTAFVAAYMADAESALRWPLW